MVSHSQPTPAEEAEAGYGRSSRHAAEQNEMAPNHSASQSDRGCDFVGEDAREQPHPPVDDHRIPVRPRCAPSTIISEASSAEYPKRSNTCRKRCCVACPPAPVVTILGCLALRHKPCVQLESRRLHVSVLADNFPVDIPRNQKNLITLESRGNEFIKGLGKLAPVECHRGSSYHVLMLQGGGKRTCLGAQG